MRRRFLAGVGALAVMLASGSVFDQTAAAQSQPAAATSERQDAERKLIREVADGLKKKAAARPRPSRKTGRRRERRGAIRTSPASTRTATRAAFRSNGPPSSRAGGSKTSPARSSPSSSRRAGMRLSRTPCGWRVSRIPQLFWWETLNAQNSRAWMVVDPPDGRIPPQTPEGAAAGRGARRGAASQRPRPRRLVRGPQPVRPVHLARPARLDDAGDLRQLLRDPPGARLRRDPLRDDS